MTTTHAKGHVPLKSHKNAGDIQTLEISNFGGRLTRKLNGDINSGMAKFATSFGYNPFVKPDNLTWLETAVDLDPNAATITDLIVCAKQRVEGGIGYIYAIGHTGRVYKIQPASIVSGGNPNLDTITLLTTLAISGNNSFNYGGSMEFYGTNRIYIGNDNRVCRIQTDGSLEVSISPSASYTTQGHPLKQFNGKLYFGNGTNIGTIDTTEAVTTYTTLSPGFPPNVTVKDIDVTPNGDYLIITASYITPEDIITIGTDRSASAAGTGFLFKWNGTDVGYTSFSVIDSFSPTALQTYLSKNYFFSEDVLGASVSDTGTAGKLLSLPNNKSPLPNAICSNGNMMSWISPESVDSTLKGSMYYYGNLDDENSLGLWRLMRLGSTQSNGFIYQNPLNIITNNKYSSLNVALTSVVTWGLGKHYFSSFDSNNGGGTLKYKLYRFIITPDGTGTSQLGVYETQNQLFGKRIALSEIRVYAEPTATGNGFQLDVIGSDGNPVTNGTFTYSYAAGTDITLLQGPVERINFNPGTIDLFSVGLRITNTGTTNMTIKKIEIDYTYSGK